MATPTPEERAGEAFVEAAAEAVQTSVMAFRLMMAITDAVRRHQQRQSGKEEELPPAEESVVKASAEVTKALPPDISAALMDSADWPLMAQQLMALQRAGVDLEAMLPRIGEVTVTVRDQVAANAARVAREVDEWAKALRETLPAGPVREAILSSPAWPEMAATMAKLDERGVDVRAILASAHEEGVGTDRAVAKVLSAAVPTTSRDAQLSYGPLTIGLDIPKNLNLGNREHALHVQLAISRTENQRFVRMVREAMPGMEREADLLVASRDWPLVAARMADMERRKEPVAEHLARLSKETSWKVGPEAQRGRRLAEAASYALQSPVGAPVKPGARVNTAAARLTSSSVDPTKAASKSTEPAAPGVAAHREAGPAAKSGKTR